MTAQRTHTDHRQIIRLKIDSFADFVQAGSLAVTLPGYDQPPEKIHSIHPPGSNQSVGTSKDEVRNYSYA